MANKKEPGRETLRLDPLQTPYLTGQGLEELRKEIEADEVAGKPEREREKAVGGLAELRRIVAEKEKAKAKAPDKAEDRDLER